MNLGSREGEDEELRAGQLPQRSVEELHARAVTPVEVLEHDHDRMRPAPRTQGILERASNLIGHRRDVLARGAERKAAAIVEVEADELTDEVADTGDLGRRHVGRDVGEELLFGLIGPLELAEAQSLPDRLGGIE